MMDAAMTTNAVSAAGVSGMLEVGAMIASFAMGSGVGGTQKNSASILSANKLRGSSFEVKNEAALKTKFPQVQPQVTVETQSGIKTRLDFVASKNNNISLFECKSSAMAPLTRNQRLAFPEIERSGAVVVGNGKPGFSGGTNIPPTSVQVIRP